MKPAIGKLLVLLVVFGAGIGAGALLFDEEDERAPSIADTPSEQIPCERGESEERVRRALEYGTAPLERYTPPLPSVRAGGDMACLERRLLCAEVDEVFECRSTVTGGSDNALPVSQGETVRIALGTPVKRIGPPKGLPDSCGVSIRVTDDPEFGEVVLPDELWTAPKAACGRPPRLRFLAQVRHDPDGVFGEVRARYLFSLLLL